MRGTRARELGGVAPRRTAPPCTAAHATPPSSRHLPIPDDRARPRRPRLFAHARRHRRGGQLAGHALPKFEQARSEPCRHDLALAESHRRRGIATALIERPSTVAVERGAWVLFVQADLGDDPAIAPLRPR
ncbi:MAG: hypothetical protein O9345_21570 [Burkholderiaceae bacterium]|nr:GNAT family N-acetyltransferase [Burkholderiales bacterium]MCZ8097420.1 hypothetical protein [Burkholderiales bacterium]MCZ8340709.1 hypothetical protein [Burkholderiaceae bacterium]